MAYVTVGEYFRAATLIISVSVVICVTLYTFFKNGLDKNYDLSPFSWQLFVLEVLVVPVVAFLAYMGLYIIIPNYISDSSLNKYLVHVIFESMIVAAISHIFAHVLMHFVRLYERGRS